MMNWLLGEGMISCWMEDRTLVLKREVEYSRLEEEGLKNRGGEKDSGCIFTLNL
jgi:hypothetical protein